MKKLTEIQVGEKFKIAGKILIFERDDNKLTVKVAGGYEQFPDMVPPTLEEVENFYELKGYTRESGKIMFDYYEAAEPKWTDKLGNTVKNWKQKSLSVWFKTAEKIKDKEESKKPVMVR